MFHQAEEYDVMVHAGRMLPHPNSPTPNSPTILTMRFYNLTYLIADEMTVVHLGMRMAHSAPDYMVTQLLAGQSGLVTEFLWHRLLEDVVLRHVHLVDARTISVVSYNADDDTIILADSNPSRIPMPDTDNEPARGWTKSMLKAVRKEQATTDRYEVSVFKIMSNLANADSGDDVWQMIENEIQPACPSRLKPDVVIDISSDDDEDAQPAPAKRCRVSAAAAAAASDEEPDEEDDQEDDE